jgi:hypothetical protein
MIRRTLLLAAVIVALLSAKAEAAGEYDIQLWVDPDFTTYLYNSTDKDIQFDGYQIVSEANTLDVAGWHSINDRIPELINDIISQLGAGALGFGELSPTSSQVAEGNLTGVGILKAGEKFSIGKPFGPNGPDWTRDNFFFKLGGIPEQFEFHITPEPSTWLLATIAGLGLAGLRVRSQRLVR